MKPFALFFLGIYRTIFTTHLGGACRFEPSCSDYAQQCFHRHTSGRALWLTLKRLSKCRPFGPWGYDPVPLQKGQNRAAAK